MFLKALLGWVLLAFLCLPATSFVFPLRNGRPCAVPASTFTAGPWVRGGGAAPLMAGMGKARRSLIHSLASSDRAEEDERLSEAEGQATTIIHAVETLIGLPVDQNETLAEITPASLMAKVEGAWVKQFESPQQLANLIILVVAGLYGLSLLLTVDMDVWRGWTWQEIVVRLPYDNWQEYEGGLTQHPVITKTLINVVIYLIGDWMSQVNWGRDKSVLDFDLARTARNGLIGAIFGPLVHYYYDFSDWILPMDVPVNRILKIIMDQTIYFITKCSMYIALVGTLRGDEPEQVVSDVKERIWPVVFRGWRFWPLAHIVTYGVIPPRHRVLWVNMLDLLWSSILAGLASKDNNTAAAPATTAVAASAAVGAEARQEEEQEGGPLKVATAAFTEKVHAVMTAMGLGKKEETVEQEQVKEHAPVAVVEPFDMLESVRSSNSKEAVVVVVEKELVDSQP